MCGTSSNLLRSILPREQRRSKGPTLFHQASSVGADKASSGNAPDPAETVILIYKLKPRKYDASWA